jgi:uncharacterized protein involved in exopolysaccharide biosynthesis
MNSVLSAFSNEFFRSWPYRWIGYFAAVVIAAGTALVVVALPDQYQAQARVYINSDTLLQPLLQGMAIENRPEGQAFALQQTLLSDTNLLRTMSLADPKFSQQSPGKRLSEASSVRSRVEIIGTGQNLFSISYYDINPKKAKDVVHAFVTLFIETNVERARKDLENASDFMDVQVKEYEKKIAELTDRMANLRVEEINLAGQGGYATRLETARAALAQAAIDQQLARQTRAVIQSKLDRGDYNASDIPPLPLTGGTQGSGSVIDRVNLLQSQLAELRQTRTDKHPDVVAVRRELDEYERLYGDDPGQLILAAPALPVRSPLPREAEVAGPYAATAEPPGPAPTQLNKPRREAPAGLRMRLLQANYAVAEAGQRAERAKGELEALAEMMKGAPTSRSELSDLDRNYKILQENYDQLIRRRESAAISQAANSSITTELFRIIEPPSEPNGPTGPDRALFLMVGGLASIAAGGLVAYLLGLLRGAYVSAAEIETGVGLPVIGTVSSTSGVLNRLGSSADAMALLLGIGAIIAASLALSVLMPLLEPVREAVYGLLQYVL